MDFFEVLEKRKSVRSFEEKEVEEEKLQKLFEAINSAPSAGNLQSYEVVVVKDSKTREKLMEASFGQGFVAEAPVVLVFFGNMDRASSRYGPRGSELYAVQDASIAVSYAQLAATALGLASCWVGAFDEKTVKEIFNAPEHLKPVAILPIGYATETPERTSRRNTEELFHLEKL